MSGQPVINEVEKKPSLGLYGRTAVSTRVENASQSPDCASPGRGEHRQLRSCLATTSTKIKPFASKALVGTEHPLLGDRQGSAKHLPPRLIFSVKVWIFFFFSPSDFCHSQEDLFGWTRNMRGENRTQIELQNCAVAFE